MSGRARYLVGEALTKTHKLAPLVTVLQEQHSHGIVVRRAAFAASASTELQQSSNRAPTEWKGTLKLQAI